MGFVAALFVAALTALAVVRILGIPLGWWRALLAGGTGTVAAGLTAASLSESGHGVQVLVAMIGAALAGGLLSAAVAELLMPATRTPSFARSAVSIASLVRDGRRAVRISRAFAEQGLTARSQPSGSRLGRALYLALSDCGGAFVKLGQLLSARPDIVPPSIAQQLTGLQDDAPPMPPDDLEQVIDEEFNASLSTLFADFDPTPVAAASIAQVHRATTLDGEAVAVKVQRLDVAEQVGRDLSILHRVAHRLERRHHWARDLQLVAMTRGLATALAEELDFRIEAQNATTIGAALAGDPQIVVPEVHDQLSSARVLVYSWIDGASVARHAERRADGPAHADRLLAAFLHQLLANGTFHADPHPGNIFIQPTGRLALLDFGSTGYLDQRQRAALGSVISALTRRNPRALRRAIIAVAPPRRAVVDHELERALDTLMLRYTSRATLDSRGIVGDLMALLRDFGLTVDPQLAGAFRAVLTLEGTLRVLDPSFDLLHAIQDKATLFGSGGRARGELGFDDLAAALRPTIAGLATLAPRGSYPSVRPPGSDEAGADSSLAPSIVADLQLTAIGIALLFTGLLSLTLVGDLEGHRLWVTAGTLAVGGTLTLRTVVTGLRLSAPGRGAEQFRR